MCGSGWHHRGGSKLGAKCGSSTWGECLGVSSQAASECGLLVASSLCGGLGVTRLLTDTAGLLKVGTRTGSATFSWLKPVLGPAQV